MDDSVVDSALHKAHNAAHTAKNHANTTWKTIDAYIPRALKHRSKGDYYLMAYNTLNLALWSFLATLVITHLRTKPAAPTLFDPSANPQTNPEIDASSHKATAQLGAYLSSLLSPLTQPLSNLRAKPSMTGIHLESHPPTWAAKIHASLDELIHRASTTYSSRSIGLAALLIQSLAVLEPAHAYLRLTRSPVSIAAAQVASRLLIVWYFVESSTDAQSSPFYASMLLAWSAAELLRSTYYLLSLLNVVPPRHDTPRALAIYANVITTLRYTAFYLLYPVGAGSEYALILKGFPAYPSKQAVLRSMGEWGAVVGVSSPPAWRVALASVSLWIREWGLGAWLRVPFVFVWPASLFVLMSYMHKQRKSALGKGPGRSIPGGKLRDVGGKKRA